MKQHRNITGTISVFLHGKHWLQPDIIHTNLPNFLALPFPHALYSYSLVITIKLFFLFAPWSFLSNSFFVASLFQNVPKTEPWASPRHSHRSLLSQHPMSTNTSPGLVAKSSAAQELFSSQAHTDPAGDSFVNQHICYLNRDAFSSPKPYNGSPFSLQMKHILELLLFASLHVCKLGFCQIPKQVNAS